MFKKIEIWVLYLVIILGIISSISFGVLVRQELDGSVKLGAISKSALFLAEIPSIVKKFVYFDMRVPDRFPEISGFQGKPLEEEKYLLLTRYNGDLQKPVVELVDLRSFKVMHTWNPKINEINALVNSSTPEFKDLYKDHHEKRGSIQHPLLTDDGGLIFNQNASPLIKIDKCSNLVWQNQEDLFHHSIEQGHDGNFWGPAIMYPHAIDKKYVGSGVGNYKDDAVTKISPDGEILFQKSISEIFIENNMEYLLFSTGDQYTFTKDPIHLNDIQPVPTDSQYWKQGDVFLSLRHQSMIILYRPSTNEIIWTGVGYTFHQHDVNILDNHRISIFNNNSKDLIKGDKVDGHNQEVIYDFVTDTYSNYLDSSFQGNQVKTVTQGRGKIMGNGDLFIEEQNYGRMLYLNEDNSLQWQYVNRADNGNVYPVNWSRILYKTYDIKKVKNLLTTKECNYE